MRLVRETLEKRFLGMALPLTRCRRVSLLWGSRFILQQAEARLDSVVGIR